MTEQSREGQGWGISGQREPWLSMEGKVPFPVGELAPEVLGFGLCLARAVCTPCTPICWVRPLLLQPLLLPACRQAWELLEQKRQAEVPRLWQQQTERARSRGEREPAPLSLSKGLAVRQTFGRTPSSRRRGFFRQEGRVLGLWAVCGGAQGHLLPSQAGPAAVAALQSRVSPRGIWTAGRQARMAPPRPRLGDKL